MIPTVKQLTAFSEQEGLKNRATELTYNLRRGLRLEGPYKFDWADKKHYLVLDACRKIEELEAELRYLKE